MKRFFDLPFVATSSVILCVLSALCGIEVGLIGAALFYSLLSLLLGHGMLRRFLPLILCLLVKTASYQLGAVDYSALGSLDESGDIRERSRYLQSEVAVPEFKLSTMPVLMSDFGKEEYAIGTLSMTAAALANIAFIYPDTRDDALIRVETLIKRMLEPDIRAFEVHLWHADPLESLAGDKDQIGYLGHLNFMLSTYRFLGGDGRFDKLHDDISTALARRMRSSRCIYLQTFPDMIFIPDNMAMVASLELYNKLHQDRFKTEVNDWLSFTKSQLVDRGTGVIYPYVSPACRGMGVVRGSYAGWNSFYLPFIDSEFAGQQYAALKATFLDERFGIIGIREYPHGVSGPPDGDSGPIILGFSTSGTGFAVAGARRSGDLTTFSRLLGTAELAGTTLRSGQERHYVFAPLVGEAIMLAMKTAVPWQPGKFTQR